MNFNGFQKLTLLDFPGKVACIVFTAGCNFRCPFCHNASLVTHIDNEIIYSEDEILSYLNKRAGIIEGVSITGGEPLMHKELSDFIKKVKALGLSVKLDTNGSFPDRLKELLDSGIVDYVAMDIKNSKEKYNLTIDCPDFSMDIIDKSIDIIMNSKVDYEFRTTVVNEFHRIQDIESVAKRISGAKAYYLQNFTDSGDLIQGNLSPVETQILKNMQKVASKYVENTQIRGI